MNFNQIFVIVLITGIALGTGYFLYTSSQEKLIEEEVEQNIEYIEENDTILQEFQEEGEKTMNYKVVDCFIRNQTPGILIYQNDKPTVNVKGLSFIICISAGEKRTGGYSLNLESINVDMKNNKILIELFLKTPEKGEMVTQAFTYPSIGIEINETLKEGDWEIIVKIEQKNGEPLILRKNFNFSN